MYSDCRFCLKKDTCKRNKANASSCRLYEEDLVAYGKYREQQERESIERIKRLENNPIMKHWFEYTKVLKELSSNNKF